MPAWVFGPLSGAPRFVIAIMLGVAAFATLALASGFGLRRKEDDEDEVEEKPAKKAAKQTVEDDGEEEREPRSFVSLGWLYHFLYSVKARLAAAADDAARTCCRGAAARAWSRCATIPPPSP